MVLQNATLQPQIAVRVAVRASSFLAFETVVVAATLEMFQAQAPPSHVSLVLLAGGLPSILASPRRDGLAGSVQRCDPCEAADPEHRGGSRSVTSQPTMLPAATALVVDSVTRSTCG